MNQKYLLGLSTDNQENESIVYFKATPENIASFLCTNKSSPQCVVYTIEGKPFLTAYKGLIDTIPDQKYLIEQLQPVLIPMQMGETPVSKLDTVSQEVAEAEPCPQPDWNYLRWDGYDDAKYQAIMSGDGLFEWEQFGKIHKIELKVQSYIEESNLAIEMVDWDKQEPEPWGILTVNLDGRREKDCAFIDINNLGDKVLPWLEENGLARPTGRMQQSGYAVYPECRFDASRLQQLDAKGYQVYLERFEKAQRKLSSRGKDGDAR